MSKSFPWLGAALLVAGVAACEPDPLELVPAGPAASVAAAETQGAVLAAVRAATAPFHDVDVALAAGYRKDTPCIFSATAGARGFIYTHFPRVDGAFEVAQPELLLYEPMPNRKLRLVGVGYIVHATAWHAVHANVPMLGNQPFVARLTAPFGGPPFPNYVQFVWAWRNNPSGMYEAFNPFVSCDFTDDTVQR